MYFHLVLRWYYFIFCGWIFFCCFGWLILLMWVKIVWWKWSLIIILKYVIYRGEGWKPPLLLLTSHQCRSVMGKLFPSQPDPIQRIFCDGHEVSKSSTIGLKWLHLKDTVLPKRRKRVSINSTFLKSINEKT